MTDNVVIPDFSFDDDANVIDAPAESGSKVHFGHLRMYPLGVDKSYTAGSYVSILGVTGGNYDQKDENGNKKFGGWVLGKTRRLFVLVATKKDKEGNPYQQIKQYKNQTDGADEPHLWRDYVLPAFKALPKEQQNKLLAGCPAKWEEIDTGIKGNLKDRETGEDKEFSYKVWANFHAYASDAEMEKASAEHFAQFNANGATASQYPAWWGDGSQLEASIKGLRDAAEAGNLVTMAGYAFKQNGVVYPKWRSCLAGILNTPEEMITFEL